jgi:hypothetical protein
MSLSRVVVLTGLTVILIGAGGTGVRAGCLENIGCTDKNAFQLRDLETMSCEALHQINSDIYTENRFCWKVWTESNKNCRYTQRAAVPLSRIERANLKTIDRAMRRKHCFGS